MKRHIHAALIHVWADGAMIQERGELTGVWHPCLFPLWKPDKTYRLKPEPQKFPTSTLSDESLDQLFGQCESGFILSLRAVADAAVKEYLLTEMEAKHQTNKATAVPLPDLGGTGPRPGLVPETAYKIERSVYSPLRDTLEWEDLPGVVVNFNSLEDARETARRLTALGRSKHCHLRVAQV